MKRRLITAYNVWVTTYILLQSVEEASSSISGSRTTRRRRDTARWMGLSNDYGVLDNNNKRVAIIDDNDEEEDCGLFGIVGLTRQIPRGGDGGGDDTSDTMRSGGDDDDETQKQEEEEEERKKTDEQDGCWRERLPVQLQKRRGALYRLVLPTGYQRRRHPPNAVQHLPTNRTIDSNDHDNNINSTDKDLEDVTCQVYLLGTAHVSKDSSTDAKILMEHAKPDVLFVELCNQRLDLLTDHDNDPTSPPPPPPPPSHSSSPSEHTNVTDHTHDQEKKASVRQMYQAALRSNPNLSRSAALSSVLLTKVQGDYATKLGVSIGEEFKEAYRVAKDQHRRYQETQARLQWERMYGIHNNNNNNDNVMDGINGCTVVLGDRPVQITLSRAYESLSFLGRIKLILGLLWSCLQQPNMNELKEWIEQILNDPDSDVLSKSIQDLSRHFPTIEETIINERDTYMACKLLQTVRLLGAATMEDGKQRTIVAVVGAGHCSGILERIRRATTTTTTTTAIMEHNNRNSIHNDGLTELIESVKQVVETKTLKLDERDDLKLLVNEVASISL